jgi:hypothetical protein
MQRARATWDGIAPVEQYGLRFGDRVKINPAIGRSVEIELNRTHYIIMMNSQDQTHHGTLWTLPKLDAPVGEFELRLVGSKKSVGCEQDGRYYLRSKKSKPFILNGNYCYEAILCRGDKVQIGYNVMEFLVPNRLLPDSVLPLPNDIVQSDLNILLQGETGTGKTTLAKIIHEQARPSGPFVHLNIASFSMSLLESELFGHVKGAFTGAHQEKLGALRESHGGTLFLDEVDSLSLEMQTKLLLFLEDRMVRPVGGNQCYQCDVRLIFASGKNLASCVAAAQMRSDFAFRLKSGFVHTVLPLRERPDHIEKLCRSFEISNGIFITKGLVEHYKKMLWPGNIRELMSHLNKKKILTKSLRLDLCALDDQLLLSEGHIEEPVGEDTLPLDEVKKYYCYKIFRKYGGSVRRSAQVLGISPATLRQMVAKNVA